MMEGQLKGESFQGHTYQMLEVSYHTNESFSYPSLLRKRTSWNGKLQNFSNKKGGD